MDRLGDEMLPCRSRKQVAHAYHSGYLVLEIAGKIAFCDAAIL